MSKIMVIKDEDSSFGKSTVGAIQKVFTGAE